MNDPLSTGLLVVVIVCLFGIAIAQHVRMNQLETRLRDHAESVAGLDRVSLRKTLEALNTRNLQLDRRMVGQGNVIDNHGLRLAAMESMLVIPEEEDCGCEDDQELPTATGDHGDGTADPANLVAGEGWEDVRTGGMDVSDVLPDRGTEGGASAPVAVAWCVTCSAQFVSHISARWHASVANRGHLIRFEIAEPATEDVGEGETVNPWT